MCENYNLKIEDLEGHGPHGILPSEDIWLEFEIADKKTTRASCIPGRLENVKGQIISVAARYGDTVGVELKGSMEGHGTDKVGSGHFKLAENEPGKQILVKLQSLGKESGVLQLVIQ